MDYLISYLIIINVIAFVAFGIDKLKAKKSWWRIPEATLIGMVSAGGSIGALLGMRYWRHKTRHRKFKYGLPAILLIHIALAMLILSNQ